MYRDNRIRSSLYIKGSSVLSIVLNLSNNWTKFCKITAYTAQRLDDKSLYNLCSRIKVFFLLVIQFLYKHQPFGINLFVFFTDVELVWLSKRRTVCCVCTEDFSPAFEHFCLVQVLLLLPSFCPQTTFDSLTCFTSFAFVVVYHFYVCQRLSFWIQNSSEWDPFSISLVRHTPIDNHLV